jgi:hypothetical protein
MVALSFGDITSGFQRPLADETAILPQSIIEKVDITTEWCMVDK